MFGGDSEKEFHFLADADMELAAVSVPMLDLQNLRDALGDVAPPTQFKLHDVLPLSDGTAHTFQTLLIHALEAAAHGRLAVHPNARRMLSLSLTDAVLQCTQSTETKRCNLAKLNKRRIVAKARAYMQLQPGAVLAVPEICKAIGASGRALQYISKDVLQVSPDTYLRLMRLNRVRGELQQLGAISVGDVAAGWASGIHRALLPSTKRYSVSCLQPH